MTKKQQFNIYRQGDVLIKKVDFIPKNFKRGELDNNRVVLAYGEVTGHAHAFKEPIKVDLLVSNDIKETQRFLHIKETAELVHEEHAPIKFEPGYYEVIQQKEYSMGQIKRVLD